MLTPPTFEQGVQLEAAQGRRVQCAKGPARLKAGVQLRHARLEAGVQLLHGRERARRRGGRHSQRGGRWGNGGSKVAEQHGVTGARSLSSLALCMMNEMNWSPPRIKKKRAQLALWMKTKSHEMQRRVMQNGGRGTNERKL